MIERFFYSLRCWQAEFTKNLRNRSVATGSGKGKQSLHFLAYLFLYARRNACRAL